MAIYSYRTSTAFDRAEQATEVVDSSNGSKRLTLAQKGGKHDS